MRRGRAAEPAPCAAQAAREGGLSALVRRTPGARDRPVVHVHPRPGQFKKDIIQAFYDGIKQKARHDLRQRQGRRARGQGPDFQTRQFLQRDSRIGLERLTRRAPPNQDIVLIESLRPLPTLAEGVVANKINRFLIAFAGDAGHRSDEVAFSRRGSIRGSGSRTAARYSAGCDSAFPFAG
jgi:hypothetical protein